jgi:hypothetical protein
MSDVLTPSIRTREVAALLATAAVNKDPKVAVRQYLPLVDQNQAAALVVALLEDISHKIAKYSRRVSVAAFINNDPDVSDRVVLDRIITVMEYTTGVSSSEIMPVKGKRSKPGLAFDARCAAAEIARGHGVKPSLIAEFFGIDRSTVLHYFNAAESSPGVLALIRAYDRFIHRHETGEVDE